MNAPALPIGVHLDLPASRYHALPGASASRLRTLWQKTPAHLWVELQKPKKVTPAMMLGTLCHQKLLEPNRPLPQLAIPPEQYPAPADSSLVKTKKVAVGDLIDWSWSAKFCKQWRKDSEAAGRLVVTSNEAEAIENGTRAVLNHAVAAPLIQGATTEVSLVTMSEEFGIPVKARLDLVPVGPDLADVKFTTDVSARAFASHAYDLGYHLQAAWYLDVWNDLAGAEQLKTRFKFIAVESAAPFAVNVFTVTPDLIALGREQYLEALAVYARCMHEDDWPAYPENVIPLEVPAWKRRQAA
ncbi:MAG: hypothetical protein E6Q97_00115 [Desulfurellales bacterium]|nr:MAG: hypothetical protein E6Q97_00115 [Desulfurellales bacterium]